MMQRFSIVLLMLVACSEPDRATVAPGDKKDAVDPVFDSQVEYDPGPDPQTDAEVDVPVDPISEDFGDACDGPADCSTGFCVEGSEGTVCTEACVDSCPNGWDCKQVYWPTTDLLFLCVPRHIRLCRPCNENDDCHVGYLENQGAGCVAGGDDGSFCGGDCADTPCPVGFDCADATLANGAQSKQCVPADGAACECKPAWASLNLTTACVNANDSGSCSGQRHCGADGLTACDAAVPGPEVCDDVDNDCDGGVDNIGGESCQTTNEYGSCTGQIVCEPGQGEQCTAPEPLEEVCNKLDDNCDGAIDEGTCDDGVACTDNVCLDDGQCSNPVSANSCLIDGSCYAATDANPADPCLQCLPDVSSTEWTNADGQSCDDGVACTHSDTCLAGACAGEDYACTDGLDCTADTCDGEGGCIYLPAPGTCAIGTACWSADDLNPDNDCTACQPDVDPGVWTATDGAACDDGAACTHTDLCSNDACSGTSYACDDGNPCTADACDGAGECTFTATGEGGACDDGQACTSGDVCTGGVCTGQDYACDDSEGCTADSCDGLGGCLFDAINEGDACNDSDPCTLDETCKSGVCEGTAKDCSALSNQCNTGVCNAGSGACEAQPKSAACDDNNACTTNDQWLGGPGAGPHKDGRALNTQSTLGTWIAGSCEKLLVSGACNDNDPCTTNDQCQGDQCTGSPTDCSLLNDACNVGVCQGGGCVKQPKPGFCTDNNNCTISDQCVNGTCVGQPMDCSFLNSACTQGVCQGGSCTQQNVAGSCTDNNSCTVGDQCVGGSCQGSPKDCSGQTDQCNNGVCTNGVCNKIPKAGSCNDSDSCTSNDTCIGGSCQGTPKNCSGLNDQCNTGVCANGTCFKSPKSGSCSDSNACTTTDKCIGGACVGTPKNCSYLNDQCNTGVCSGGSCSKSAKSGSCNDNNSCTSNDTCSGGSCSGSAITDNFESNNSYVGKHVSDVTDCAGLDKSLSASLYPSGDIDWFWFKVSDTTGCDVQPKITLTPPSGTNYQLCAYFECNNGSDVDLNCLEGSKVSGPKAGTAGCCSTKSGSQAESVRLGPQCSFAGLGDESGYIDIKVYKSSGNTCSSYTLKWGDS